MIAMLSDDYMLFDTYYHVTEGGRWFVAGWMFVLGSMFGSFMNVVVYRVPRGMSLSHPGSRCPSCSHPIRWHDNVPIAGWLMLRGRCRDCQAPISARYPLVEALVGAISVGLAWSAARQAMPFVPEAPTEVGFVCAIYAFHMLLVCTLVCGALIDLDGQRVPAKMLVAVLIVGFVAASVWPDLRFEPAVGDGQLRGVVHGAAGLFVAGLLGALAWPGLVTGCRERPIAAGLTAVGELALVGVFLGARASCFVAVAGMALYVAAQGVSRIWPAAGRFGWAPWLAAVTLVHIVAWPELVATWPRLADESGLTVLIVCGAIVAVLAVVSWLARSNDKASHGL